ncbi:nucleotidyltransferase family protein [Vibrio coralliilyticus]|uniref:nucleotidyltransferase family protein n=1 Tax=Vibrio TaxID=662 RepID=UPI0005018D8F|nr:MULTISPECIES: nucleotidyltransferase family protein [Vibrio]KFI12126.1 nitrate reductase [Vibrio sp. B183]NOI19190.1 nucleotidyltransferase family protein [Vibrio coralliilyticus]
MENYSDKIIQWIEKDSFRMRALACVAESEIPHAFLAAGFVRNLVWDALHHKETPTPLNDLDVIYFDLNESDPERYKAYELELQELMPDANWQVRNQAMMHERNGDRAYTDLIDAMSFWPEKETAVAIRQLARGEYQCLSSFGFDSLFELKVSHNSSRDIAIFKRRLQSKNWLTIWPNLIIDITNTNDQ